MNFQGLIYAPLIVSFCLAGQVAVAGTSASTEMGFAYRYDSLKSPNGVYANQDFQGFYLKPYRAVWAGAEITYATHTNPDYGTKVMELGGLVKYWVMTPGQGFSFNLFLGFAVGKDNNGFASNSTMALKAGPEFAYFILDGVSVSTRLQYTSRKSGESFTGIGAHSGLAIFF